MIYSQILHVSLEGPPSKGRSSQDPSPSLLSFFAHPFPSPFPSVQLSSMNDAVAEISDNSKKKLIPENRNFHVNHIS